MANTPLRVIILGLPESTHSTIAGLSDIFNVFHELKGLDDAFPDDVPFVADIAGWPNDARLPYRTRCCIKDIEHTDIVIVPSLLVSVTDWEPGKYPEVVSWLRTMHAQGATLCSTCSGALLLAETGLLEGSVATTHWAYAETFKRCFPGIPLQLENLLVRGGAQRDIVMSGASGSWHDLALYLIAHHVSLAAAQTIAKFLLLEWHVDGQLPYRVFMPYRDHGDAIVCEAQDWLARNINAHNPVEAMTATAGLAPRTFKRRFTNATGYTPIRYVQELRIEKAKRHLERSSTAVEEIAYKVGYEEPAFFRRLFKRMVGISPGAYRRKLQLPGFARAID